MIDGVLLLMRANRSDIYNTVWRRRKSSRSFPQAVSPRSSSDSCSSPPTAHAPPPIPTPHSSPSPTASKGKASPNSSLVSSWGPNKVALLPLSLNQEGSGQPAEELLVRPRPEQFGQVRLYRAALRTNHAAEPGGQDQGAAGRSPGAPVQPR
jgi:hypothetical protein